MFREQMINFLEATVVLLTLTNAVSVAAAAYAISIAHGLTGRHSKSSEQASSLGFLSRVFRMDQ
jgi:hypothetical protein